MPEGHTIHRIARDHQRDFAGQRLTLSSPQGRFADGARRLTGKELVAVEAYGKHLFYRWDGRNVLHIHLGLYGKFRRHRVPVPDPIGQVRLRAVGAESAFDLNGPTACEVLPPAQVSRILARLGPDPLRKDADPEQVWQRIRKSRAPLGTLLLNQSVLAGVGNVYRSEVLFLQKIHPDRPGQALSREEFDGLWQRLVTLLEIGVRYNRIIVADPNEVGKPRSRMNRSERLLIYKRATCVHCDGSIRSYVLGARKIFACDRCQRR